MAGVVIAVGAAGWPSAGWSSPVWAHAGGEPADNIAHAMAAPEIVLFFMGRPVLLAGSAGVQPRQEPVSGPEARGPTLRKVRASSVLPTPLPQAGSAPVRALRRRRWRRWRVRCRWQSAPSGTRI